MKTAIRCLLLVCAAAAYSSCSTAHDVHYVDHHYYHHDSDYVYTRPADSYRTTSVYRESEPEGFNVVNQYDRQDR
jgi:hypothetical protein